MTKVTSGILGIIIGIWFCIFSLGTGLSLVIVLAIFGIEDLPPGAETVLTIGLYVPLVSIFGGVLTFFKPRIGGVCMLVGSIGPLILTVWMFINITATVPSVLITLLLVVVPLILLIVAGVSAVQTSRRLFA